MKKMKQKIKKEPEQVLICSRSKSPYHKEVTSRFTAAITQEFGDSVECHQVEFSSSSLEVFAMRMHDNHILNAKIVVPIGFSVTKYLLDLLRHAKPRPHLVSIGADLSDDEAGFSRGWATMVATEQEEMLDRRGQILLYLKPNLKRVGILYASTGTSVYVQRQLNALRSFFISRGVEALFIPVPNPDALESVVSEYIRTLEVVMVVEGDYCSGQNEELIRICTKHQVAFYATTLAAARAGAALAYGVDPAFAAQAAAGEVLSILKNESSYEPSLIQLSDSRRIVVNAKAAMRQGFYFDKTMLFLLKESMVFTDVRSVGPLVRETFF
jgi:hypothetical protein